MSIYDKASLVMIPSGTKASKVFSQKPVNGDGDFTFSRSTAATRVNADGNIEKETQNLLLQSNSFDTTWTASSINVTGGQSGYDGSSDAWLISKSASHGHLRQNNTTSGVKSLSVYAKEGSSSWIRVRFDNSPSGDQNAWINLNNGSIGTSNAIAAYTESIGSGWYRVVIQSSSTDLNNVRIYPAEANESTTSASGNIYIQDAQLEQGLVARDYIETTTAAVEGGITDNVPRLDYTDSSCPALLLEPQRTNVCPNSEDVSNWTLAFATATANDTISPEGVQNAAKIVTSSAGCDVKLTSIPVSASTTYTATFYCKLTSGSGLQTRFYDNTNGANIEYYTYDSQLVVGEWKRVTRTFTTPAGCNNIQIWFLAASSSSSVTAHYWGYQLEAGSYATSYIPTYGTSVTRGKDDCTIADTGDIIADSKGSFFIDLDVDFLDNNGLIPITAGSGTAALYYLWLTTGGTIRSEWYNGGGLQAAIATSGGYFNIGDRLKIAAGYQDNDFVMYVNGTLIGTDTSGNAPSPTLLRIGKYNVDNYTGGAINQFLAFPTRLSNEELAALTTI